MSNKNSHTSSLFHYTKNQNSLFSILKDGLKVSYCREMISDTVMIAIPMVSFCDLPLSRCLEHREKYGRYAVGIKKEAFNRIPLDYQLGPVNYFRDSQNGLFDDLKTMVESKNQVVGWFKRFEMLRNKKRQINYDECEWRMIYFCDRRQWFWDKNEYDTWRGGRNDTFFENAVITFTPNDVNYILVYQDSNVANVIKRIMNLRQFSGNIISDKEKLLLISKIISFDQLRLDY